MEEIPNRCPNCDVPLKYSRNGRVPGIRDVSIAQEPLYYCPKCKMAWSTFTQRDAPTP